MPVVVVSTKKKKSASYGNKGYFCSGYKASGTDSSHIDLFVFATEVMSQLAATLVLPREGAFELTAATKGYVAAGCDRNGGMIYTGTVEALTWSTETISNLGSILLGRAWGSACYSSTIGYCMGGNNATPVLNTIDGLNYSTETLRSVTETLDLARKASGNMQNATTGFICGGYTNGWPYATTLTIENFNFATEVISTAAESMETYKSEHATNSYADAGYCFGGRLYYYGTPYFNKSIEKLVYSTGVTSTLVETLAVNKDQPQGTNQASKGVIAGGAINDTSYTPSYNCEIFDPATETISASSEVLNDAFMLACCLRN